MAQPLGPVVAGARCKPPDRTTLTGRYVIVAPLDENRDSQPLWEGLGGTANAGLWTYFSSGPFEQRKAFDGYIQTNCASKDPLFFAILDANSHRALGQAAYMRIAPEHRCIEVGNIVFAPALQRTIGATEAMYLMARHAFEELGYRRYEWKCHALNEPSRRAALRLGFEFEGIFRQHMIVKDRNRDTAWFSLLDREWPARKAAFERWLDPSNSDADGKQRVSLSALRPS